MKQKKLKITLEDFILANRRASRMEEIERHGRQVQSKRIVHKSKKTYDRNRLKRAVIKSDDGSFIFSLELRFFRRSLRPLYPTGQLLPSHFCVYTSFHRHISNDFCLIQNCPINREGYMSTHSLRKTFGRKIVERAGDNPEMALIKLSELFNHSSIQITRRYLGLRQEELLEIYETLTF